MTDGCYRLGSRTIWEVLKAAKIVQKRSVEGREGEPEQILLMMKRKTDCHFGTGIMCQGMELSCCIETRMADSENNNIRVTYVTLCSFEGSENNAEKGCEIRRR